jgi:hypothetical protein
MSVENIPYPVKNPVRDDMSVEDDMSGQSQFKRLLSRGAFTVSAICRNCSEPQTNDIRSSSPLSTTGKSEEKN